LVGQNKGDVETGSRETDREKEYVMAVRGKRKEREGRGEEKCEKRIAGRRGEWKKIVSHHLFDCCGF